MPIGRRQCALLLAIGLLLAACDTAKKPDFGQIGAVPGFIGGAVVEEPHAALAARDTLSAGGTAADAMVAAFFTMVATYPVAVGLGGGGACIHYDAITNTAETLDFLAVAPGEGGTVAVPGTIRGMALLHSRFGRLRFGQLMRTGETLARFGHPISRALVRRSASSQQRLAGDPLLRKTFLHADGSNLQEGDQLVQFELASALTRLRTKGIADFYGGELGHRFVEEAQAAGGKVTLEDLRAYRAVWRGVQKSAADNLSVYHLQPPPAAGSVLRELSLTARRKAAPSPESLEGLAAMRSGDAGVATAVTVDRRGSAAACAFTMHTAYGLGRVAPTMGVPLAPVEQAGAMPLALVVAANENLQQAFFAGAASGGPGALAALAQVDADILAHGLTLEEAMARPRQVPALPGETARDEGADRQSPIGRVQALWCSLGVKRAPKTCRFVSDSRGFGLAASQVF